MLRTRMTTTTVAGMGGGGGGVDICFFVCFFSKKPFLIQTYFPLFFPLKCIFGFCFLSFKYFKDYFHILYKC